MILHSKSLFFVFTLLICGIVKAQIITTIAGNDTRGFSGDGGPANTALLNTPTAIAFDSIGNLYIADQRNCMRKINTSGIISTIVGDDTDGYRGDGGPATAARLSSPFGIAIDNSNNIYIADSYNECIRKINPAGIISTFAGNHIIGYSGDGMPATAAEFQSPSDVAIDILGNVYIADQINQRIRKVDTSGIVTTIAGSGTEGYGGDGGPATAAQFHFPCSVAVDDSGNIFIGDFYNNRIRKVNKAGVISTIAGDGTVGYSGDGGLATAAQIFKPLGVRVDKHGNVFFSDIGNFRIRKIDSSGVITSVAGNGIQGYSGDGGLAISAQLSGWTGVGIDLADNVYIADIDNNRIRKVDLTKTSVMLQPRLISGLDIYPNPTQNELTITVPTKITQLTINNLLGQTVYTNEYKTEKVQIDATDLPTGVYFVKINDSEGRKFVKE